MTQTYYRGVYLEEDEDAVVICGFSINEMRSERLTSYILTPISFAHAMMEPHHPISLMGPSPSCRVSSCDMNQPWEGTEKW